VRDCALGNPEVFSSSVRRFVAEDLGMKPLEFERGYARARAVYAEARQARLEHNQAREAFLRQAAVDST
jgi:hypothetical protein